MCPCVYVRCKNYFIFRASKCGSKYILGGKSTDVCLHMYFPSLFITCGDHRVSASFRTSWRALQILSFSLLFSSSCSFFISGSSSGMLSYGGLNERIKLSLHRCGPHEGHRLRPFVLSRSILLPCLIILICALLVRRFRCNALFVSFRFCYYLHFALDGLTLLLQYFSAFLFPLHFDIVRRLSLSVIIVIEVFPFVYSGYVIISIRYKKRIILIAHLYK